MHTNKIVTDMDIPFIYYKPVTGKHFIGRLPDQNTLANLMIQGETVVIYEPPKSGKASLIQQTFFNMKVRRIQFSVAEFSFLNIRTLADAVMGLGTSIIKSIGSLHEDYAGYVEHFLPGTHFTFDPEEFARSGRILSLNWDIDDNDIESVLRLPYIIAKETSQKQFVVIDEFQNIMETEDGEHFCKLFENVLKEIEPDKKQNASYVLSGSKVNAMKEIFEGRKFFFRQHERVKLSEVESKDIIDSAVRNFLAEGKVLDRDLMLGACKLFKCNVWYINHFCAICDSLSKGYIMEPILIEALTALIAVNEPRFKATMNDLTTFQICLLRAILDGQTRFSSSEVIRRYNLNSSANVRRLKDALCKKEIVTFEEDDNAVILDPLFEYWVSKYFFGIKTD